MVLEKDAKLSDGSRDAEVAPLPYLGRSVRLVGDWQSVNAGETPHEKNKRGELGKGPYNWYFNRTSLDPLGRTATANSAADRRNTIEHVIAHSPKGKVNPERLDVTDAQAMTAHIKRVAKHLGASDVGIMKVSPSFLYSEGRYPDDGTGAVSQTQDMITAEETAKLYPYAIVLVYAWDYEMARAHRHRIGDAAYHFGAEKLRATYANLASYPAASPYSPSSPAPRHGPKHGIPGQWRFLALNRMDRGLV